jgi:8-oxo-dGTP pyrophosphatase MutT (NUDIX family)
MKDGKNFNVRVYGLIINHQNELLIAEEFHYNTFMRKFPGGGLQFGEGPKDGLKRELKEELDIDIADMAHLHTTDMFVKSLFNDNHQVIGIYFLVMPQFDLAKAYRSEYELPSTEGEERFRWVPLSQIHPADFTFPVDRQAVEVLIETLQGSQRES